MLYPASLTSWTMLFIWTLAFLSTSQWWWGQWWPCFVCWGKSRVIKLWFLFIYQTLYNMKRMLVYASIENSNCDELQENINRFMYFYIIHCAVWVSGQHTCFYFSTLMQNSVQIATILNWDQQRKSFRHGLMY